MGPTSVHETMQIAVYADLHGRLQIDPDPAIVGVGTPIEWHFVLGGGPPRYNLRWEVYFDHTRAFPWRIRTLQTSPDQEEEGHIGVLYAGEAEKLGDHKYGVRVIQADSGENLGDDDPRLVVRP